MSYADLIPLCQRSLVAYAVAQWQGYQPAAHHRAIANALERVANGSLKRLMISMPPRNGKSMLASEYFPAWYLGHHPDHQIIHASYSQELVDGFGRKVRNQLRDELYTAIFPGTRLSDDSQAANKFSTTASGVYFATGIEGSATGRGAHCLPRGTLVETPVGPVPIEALQPGCAVIALDPTTGRKGVTHGVALASRRAGELVRVHTSSGHVIEATPNHRFLTPRGWVQAGEIAPGDVLVRLVPNVGDTASGRGEQAAAQGAHGDVLRAGVLAGPSRGQEPSVVPRLSGADVEENAGLLSSVQAQAYGPGNAVPVADLELHDLQYAVHGDVAGALCRSAREVLRQALRPDWALQQDVGRREPQVERRGDPSAGTGALGQGLPGDASAGAGTRPAQLRLLWAHDGPAGGASRGREPDQQRAAQPGDAVLRASPAGAPHVGLSFDVVAGVCRVHGDVEVFDLQTPWGNFFAAGLCVHNCLLIDDPIKDRSDADSERMRIALKDWYTSVAYTRLMPGGAVIVIQTRWHEDDLMGWLLQDHGHENWEVMSLPAWDDNDNPTQALWPEMFPIERLRQIKNTLPPRDWEALYMQRPRAGTGAAFKRGWLNHYDGQLQHKAMYRIMLVDPATSQPNRVNNDYTSMWIIGLGEDENYYVLDMVRDRFDLTERTEAVFRLHRKWKPAQVRYERYGMMADTENLRNEMNRRSYRFSLTEVGGSAPKVDRIKRLTAPFTAGRVWLPRELIYTDTAGKTRDLVHHFIEQEYLAFPVGRHDDMLDALSRMMEPSLDTPWPSKRQNMGPVLAFGVLDATVGY